LTLAVLRNSVIVLVLNLRCEPFAFLFFVSPPLSFPPFSPFGGRVQLAHAPPRIWQKAGGGPAEHFKGAARMTVSSAERQSFLSPSPFPLLAAFLFFSLVRSFCKSEYNPFSLESMFHLVTSESVLVIIDLGGAVSLVLPRFFLSRFSLPLPLLLFDPVLLPIAEKSTSPPVGALSFGLRSCH